MPNEILVLIDKPLLLFLVLAIGATVGIAVERFVEELRRAEKRAFWRGRKSGGRVAPIQANSAKASTDAADQLRCVENAKFSARPLLNAGERRVFSALDRAVAEHAPGWRVMGQVALGEILASPDKAAFAAINSKRVDLMIVDNEYLPIHAVEFQGAGHYQSSAAARDAVKKEALRRAKVGYYEVMSGDKPGELRELVRKLADRRKPPEAA